MTGKEELLDFNGNTVEGLPDSYDNITEDGRVLYLDEERMRRKEQPDKPIWKNAPRGLGIKDFVVTHTSARSWNWKIVLKVFRAILNASVVLKNPSTFKAKLYMYAMMFKPEDHSYSAGNAYQLKVDVDPSDAKTTKDGGPAVLPVSAYEQERAKTLKTVKPTVLEVGKDLSHLSDSVTVPYDLVRKAIMEAEYIGGMKECLCRAGGDCQDYPKDLACLFLNMGGKIVVDHGMAVELTKQEALARVDRAAELGLVCQSLWVQVEQLIWGFKNEQMDSFMEVCFCCPCCCVALNLSHNSTRAIQRGFSPSGWTAVVDHNACVGCKKCATTRYCPQDAIHFRKSDGKMVVNQEACIGCGICRADCPEGAIKIKQTMPMRNSIQEYFHDEARLDIVSGL